MKDMKRNNRQVVRYGDELVYLNGDGTMTDVRRPVKRVVSKKPVSKVVSKKVVNKPSVIERAVVAMWYSCKFWCIMSLIGMCWSSEHSGSFTSFVVMFASMTTGLVAFSWGVAKWAEREVAAGRGIRV